MKKNLLFIPFSLIHDSYNKQGYFFCFDILAIKLDIVRYLFSVEINKEGTKKTLNIWLGFYQLIKNKRI